MTRNRMILLCLTLTIAGCSSGGEKKASDSDNDGTPDSLDCAPQVAQTWQMLSFASVDEDADGSRVNASGQVCAGSTLPANRSATAGSVDSVDCDDKDASKWSTRSYAAVDDDNDGHSAAQSGHICTGAALPAGLIAKVPVAAELDCDDADADRWRVMAMYRDEDEDGVGAGAALRECIGNVPRSGYVLTGYDPIDDPDDPLARTTTTFDVDSSLLTPQEDGDEDDDFPPF